MARLLLISVLFAIPASASAPGDEEISTSHTAAYDEILLKDGTLLRGDIIEERDDLVIFETRSLGRLEIQRAQIVRIAPRGMISGVLTDPDQNSIMFCPTPATLPKGDFYFRDFELFILNFGFGITDGIDISVGTLFPVSSSVLMLSIGGKIRVLDRDRSPIGLALIGNYTTLKDTRFGMVGAVAGIGDVHKSLNLAVNRTFDDDDEQGTTYIAGADIQIGRRSKIFAEFFNSSMLLGDDKDLKGFINIGIRWFGRAHSFSLSGFRPLVEDSGSFIAFPMVMYSRHW